MTTNSLPSEPTSRERREARRRRMAERPHHLDTPLATVGFRVYAEYGSYKLNDGTRVPIRCEVHPDGGTWPVWINQTTFQLASRDLTYREAQDIRRRLHGAVTVEAVI